MEDRRRHVRTNARRDALTPRLLETERPEQPECEKRQRDERDERAKADRRRVDEQAVLAEVGGQLVQEPPSRRCVRRRAPSHASTVPGARKSTLDARRAPVGFWMINRVPAILTLEGV